MDIESHGHSSVLSAHLNKLIVCEQHRGVVRYVGPVEGTSDTEPWFGIEWKEPARGKHDGSHNGVRYFQSAHPTGASFVRASKVELGVDIWSAAEQKYFEQVEFERKAATRAENQDTLLYNNFSMEGINSMLKCVNLAYCKVSSVASAARLQQRFTSMIELDLEGNLVAAWDDVFVVLDQLKQLKLINVSNNYLSAPSNEQPTRVYTNIEQLVINRMNYEWSDVLRVIAHFPRLVELKVCFNAINRIDTLSEQLIDNLRLLDIASNPVGDWRNLAKLGQMKTLESLNASSIGVAELSFGADSFANLRSLALNDNAINHWQSIDELDKLTQLSELRFRSNPLNGTDRQTTVRQLFIAKISRLLIFNRTPIEADERKDAERDYLKQFAPAWFQLQDLAADDTKRAAFRREHPRYDAIVQKYGATERSEIVAPETIQRSLLALRVRNEVTGETLTRQFPPSIEIRRLKLVVSKMFKSTSFDLEAATLSYANQQNAGERFVFDNDMRNLSFYSLESGDTIIISAD